MTTDTLEHIRDWRAAIHNIREILKIGGLLIATTRSRGFPYHGFPADFWRYGIEDFQTIFSDLIIDHLSRDSQEPGVFLRARKPFDFVENDIDTLRLYDILAGAAALRIEDSHVGSARCLLLM